MERIGSALGWTVPGRIVGRALQLAIQLLLGRGLGAAAFGIYSFGHAAMEIVKQVSLLGMQNGVVRVASVRFAEGDSRAARRTLIAAFSVTALVACGAALALWALAEPLVGRAMGRPEFVPALRVFAFAVPVLTVLTVAQYSARALRRVHVEILLGDLLHPALVLSAVAAVVAWGLGWREAALGFVLASACAAAVGTAITARSLRGMPAAGAGRFRLAELLRVSLPILFAGSAYVMLGHTDKLMLGVLGGASRLGIYTVAFRVSRQVATVQALFAPVVSPLIVEAERARDPEPLRRLYQSLVRWLLTVAIPLCALIVVLVDGILALFGPEFASARWLLVALTCLQPLGTVGWAAMLVLQMGGRQDDDVKILGAGLALNVVANFLLIPPFGAPGAAAATGGAWIAIALLRIRRVRARFGMSPAGGGIGKPVLAGLGGIAAGLLSRAALPGAPGLLAAALATLAAYVALLLALGAPEEDRQLVRSLLRRPPDGRADVPPPGDAS